LHKKVGLVMTGYFSEACRRRVDLEPEPWADEKFFYCRLPLGHRGDCSLRPMMVRQGRPARRLRWGRLLAFGFILGAILWALG
jgi:hypothetical protein